MSRTTRHVYEVIHVGRPGDTNVQVGGHLVDDNHVRKHHEPNRSWQFFDTKGGNGWSIVGKHIGEYEKVKHLMAVMNKEL